MQEGRSETELSASALAAAAREEVPLHHSLANDVLAVAERKALKVLTFALLIRTGNCVNTCLNAQHILAEAAVGMQSIVADPVGLRETDMD